MSKRTKNKIKTEKRPTGEFVVITPADAVKYVEQADAAGFTNRYISQNKVMEYAMEMQNDWDAATSVIQVDLTGVLVNGYHRMWACIEADLPFETFLIVTPDRKRTLGKTDTGRKRSAGDVLVIEGWRYAVATAAALRMKMRHRATGYPFKLSFPVTNTMILEAADHNRHTINKIHNSLNYSTNKVTPLSKLIFLQLTARQQANASDFCFEIVHGYRTDESGLPRRSASFVLREKLLQARQARHLNRRAEILDFRQETYVICMAYKKWLKDISITRISLPKIKIGDTIRDVEEAYKIPKVL